MSLAQVQLCTGEAEADQERDLIERAKRDPDAFAALYQQHYPMLPASRAFCCPPHL